jgi:hypothetical protein
MGEMKQLLLGVYSQTKRNGAVNNPDRFIYYSGYFQASGSVFRRAAGRRCRRALSFTACPSFKSVKNILVTGQDKLEPEKPVAKDMSSEYGYVRGAAYYGRERK